MSQFQKSDIFNLVLDVLYLSLKWVVDANVKAPWSHLFDPEWAVISIIQTEALSSVCSSQKSLCSKHMLF